MQINTEENRMTVKDFGAKLAKWVLSLEEVEFGVEIDFFPPLAIPVECCEEMLDYDITSPDPCEFWRGYNEYLLINMYSGLSS